jgi:titin
MPAAYIEIDPATINYGAAQTVTAIARNGDGSPITGRSLTLSASTSGASASCSGRKTTATTNSSGRATFKVCPVKTATWSVDGRSIVGSAGVRLTVQLTPTAPRTLVATPKTRSVSLVWAAPAKANASSVADYIVQYRLQGATTWVTFRDGTSTARKATVTGLTSGQIYEFRVAAKNKSGTGTWSNVVLGTPN